MPKTNLRSKEYGSQKNIDVWDLLISRRLNFDESSRNPPFNRLCSLEEPPIG